MAVSAGVIWEIRSTATAGNQNGGGFKAGASGTDWSQQDGVKYALTGGTNGAASATVLHASAAADWVGNTCYCVSGTNFTTGWYEIISVSAGVSFTVDRSMTTGAGSSGVINIGGALSLGSALDSTWSAAVSAGNTIYVKGNVSLGASSTITNGAAGTPITFQGYLASRGDLPSGANRPQINCAAFTLTVGARTTMQSLRLTGTAANVCTVGTAVHVDNCQSINTSTTAARTAWNLGSLGSLLTNCEGISYRGVALTAGNQVFAYGCYFHDSDTGIKVTTASPVGLINNLIESNVSNAINYTGAPTSGSVIYGNTLYGSEKKTGVGINIALGATLIWIHNNVIYGFTTGISDANGTGSNLADFNAVNNCTTAYSGITTGAGGITTAPAFKSVAQYTGTAATTSGSVLTDAAAAFTNVTDNQDFCYIVSGTGITAGQYLITGHSATTLTLDIAPGTSATADKTYQVTTGRNFGVGTNYRQNAFPGAFPAGLTTSYADFGAAQRDYNLEVPAVSDVRSGTQFASGSLTGTLVTGSKHIGPGRMG